MFDSIAIFDIDLQVEQKPGDVIITGHDAAHWGFNAGMNYAVAINTSHSDNWLQLYNVCLWCEFELYYITVTL